MMRRIIYAGGGLAGSLVVAAERIAAVR